MHIRSAKRGLIPPPPEFGITDEMLAKVVVPIAHLIEGEGRYRLLCGLRVMVQWYLGPLWLDRQYGNGTQTAQRLAKIEKLVRDLLDEIEGLHPLDALFLSGAGQPPSSRDNQVNRLTSELSAFLASLRESKLGRARRTGRPTNHQLRLVVFHTAQFFEEATGERVIASISRASGYDAKLGGVCAGSMLEFMKLLEPKLGESNIVVALARARKDRSPGGGEPEPSG